MSFWYRNLKQQNLQASQPLNRLLQSKFLHRDFRKEAIFEMNACLEFTSRSWTLSKLFPSIKRCTCESIASGHTNFPSGQWFMFLNLWVLNPWWRAHCKSRISSNCFCFCSGLFIVACPNIGMHYNTVCLWSGGLAWKKADTNWYKKNIRMNSFYQVHFDWTVCFVTKDKQYSVKIFLVKLRFNLLFK